MTKRFENAIRAAEPDGTALSSRIPEHYSLSHDDLDGLLMMVFSGEYFDALDRAFTFGFVMGNRATYARNLERL